MKTLRSQLARAYTRWEHYLTSMEGERVVDPELALAALSEGNNPLTSREHEVLSDALPGASIAEIAARLHLSEGTVRNRLSVAIQKLGARNRMEAARPAEQKGWPIYRPLHIVVKGRVKLWQRVRWPRNWALNLGTRYLS